MRDERALARRSRRHHAEAAFAEIAAVVVGELGRNLVVVVGEAALDEGVVFQAERQQHGLFQPLVRDPLAVYLLGDAQLSLVQLGDDAVDRFLELRVGIARGDLGAAFEILFR